MEKGAPVVEVDVTHNKHRRVLEQHSPYHVRRLPKAYRLALTAGTGGRSAPPRAAYRFRPSAPPPPAPPPRVIPFPTAAPSRD